MLYVFHGTDIPKGVGRAHSLIDSLRTKRPDAAYEEISSENWNPGLLEGHLGGQGLFSSKYIVFLDRIVTNSPADSEAREQFPDFISALQESTNIFIVLEGKINADLKKNFEKHAEKIIACEETVSAKGPIGKKDFNIFSLADAVGNRNAFKAWSIYREAMDNGLEAESVAGTLFWQVKSMILARDAKSAGEAGLNPFVFTKAKKSAGSYSPEELADLSEKIIAIYHDGHRGVKNIELSLESLLLLGA